VAGIYRTYRLKFNNRHSREIDGYHITKPILHGSAFGVVVPEPSKAHYPNRSL